jgi:hypothetical protein
MHFEACLVIWKLSLPSKLILTWITEQDTDLYVVMFFMVYTNIVKTFSVDMSLWLTKFFSEMIMICRNRSGWAVWFILWWMVFVTHATSFEGVAQNTGVMVEVGTCSVILSLDEA